MMDRKEANTMLSGRIVIFCLLGIVLIAALSLAGCGGDTPKPVETVEVNPNLPYPPPAKYGDMPSPTMNLYFAKPQNGQVSYVGFPGFGIGVMGLGDATWIVPNNSDYEYFGGHDGGVLDTLVIVSKKDGITICWAYNTIFQIELSDGWQGQIQTGLSELSGIRLGSNEKDFLTLFPGAKKGRSVEYGGNEYDTFFTFPSSKKYFAVNGVETRRLVIACDLDGIIKQITVNDDDKDTLFQ